MPRLKKTLPPTEESKPPDLKEMLAKAIQDGRYDIAEKLLAVINGSQQTAVTASIQDNLPRKQIFKCNTFEDSVSLAKLDRKRKKKLDYPEPTPRRPPVKQIKVHCDGCGRICWIYSYQMQRSVAGDQGDNGGEPWYKCNNCVGEKPSRGNR